MMTEKLLIGLFILIASGWLIWIIRALINYDRYVDRVIQDEDEEKE